MGYENENAMPGSNNQARSQIEVAEVWDRTSPKGLNYVSIRFDVVSLRKMLDANPDATKIYGAIFGNTAKQPGDDRSDGRVIWSPKKDD